MLCMIHCMGLPVLAVFYPGFSAEAYETQIHTILALLVLGLGVQAFYRGYQRHRNLCPAMIAGVGFVVLLIGLFVQVQIPFISSSEVFFSSLGSAMLVGAHLINIGTARQHGCSCKAPQPEILKIS